MKGLCKEQVKDNSIQFIELLLEQVKDKIGFGGAVLVHA